MWYLLEISGEKWLATCTLTGDVVNFLLYNMQTVLWGETNVTVGEIMERAKEKNRRIQLSQEKLLQCLQYSVPQAASFADSSPLHSEQQRLECKYKLGQLPLKFEWMLQKQNMQKLFAGFVLLFEQINQLQSESKELREIVQKKDIEIETYKKEGAQLKRKTLATQPFNLAAFDSRFGVSHQNSENFKLLSEYFKNFATSGSVDNNETNSNDNKCLPATVPNNNVAKQEDNSMSKLSPRKRKRLEIERKKEELARRKLNAKQIEFENSQELI